MRCQSPVKNFIIFKYLEQAGCTVPVFLSALGLVRFAHPPRWAEAIEMPQCLGCLQMMLCMAEQDLLITAGQLLEGDGKDCQSKCIVTACPENHPLALTHKP